MNDRLNGAAEGAHDDTTDESAAGQPATAGSATPGDPGTTREPGTPPGQGTTQGSGTPGGPGTPPDPGTASGSGTPSGAPNDASQAGGGRFGIRRSRTRAEERIAELDTSPVKLTAELDAMRARAESAEAELVETKAGWQRTAADFQNYRRRTEQERADLATFASEGLLRRVLAIADDFDRAIAHAPSDPAAAAWVEGVAAIDRKVRLLLDSEGVTAIAALGEKFDPYRHEAIIHEPTTEAPDGTVIKELQRGYELNGRVLRPALVAVADNSTSQLTTIDGANVAPQSEDQD